MAPVPDPAGAVPLGTRLAEVGASLRQELDGAHRARELSLRSCRECIRHCGLAIRAVHRQLPEAVGEHAGLAESALRAAQQALEPYPRLAAAGFLHDAEKEYAEARLTAALVAGAPLPDHRQLAVAAAAWLNGLAEGASELRRHLLDRIRDGELARGEGLLEAMADCYDLLVTVDFPDAVTGGLRRATDALRAVLERSRSDVTTTTLQVRLQQSMDRLSAQLGTGSCSGNRPDYPGGGRRPPDSRPSG